MEIELALALHARLTGALHALAEEDLRVAIALLGGNVARSSIFFTVHHVCKILHIVEAWLLLVSSSSFSSFLQSILIFLSILFIIMLH